MRRPLGVKCYRGRTSTVLYDWLQAAHDHTVRFRNGEVTAGQGKRLFVPV